MNLTPIKIAPYLVDEPAEREAIVAEGCGMMKEAPRAPQTKDKTHAPAGSRA